MGLSGEQAGARFSSLFTDIGRLTVWHTLFMFLTALIVARGIHKGVAKGVWVIMPLLFVLLIVLLGYSLVETDPLGQVFSFLFSFNFSQLTWEAVWVAMEHSLFTLSMGVGAVMVYGAYMPKQASIGSAVMTVAVLDTVVALVAGMAIFPIVLVNGIEPSVGLASLFVSLSTAFGQMPGGQLFGALFFVVVSLAALSSAIAMIEPAIAWATERFLITRVVATAIISALVWLIGMGTVFSFSVWSGEAYQVLGMTVFELLNFVTRTILLPLGCLLLAIFAGWIMKRSVIYKELNLSLVKFNLWRALCRVIAPVCVLIIWGVSLYKLFV